MDHRAAGSTNPADDEPAGTLERKGKSPSRADRLGQAAATSRRGGVFEEKKNRAAREEPQQR